MKEGIIEGWDTEAVGGVTGLVVVALAAGVSALISVFARQIGARLRLLDIPDGKRKIHPAATPQIGGLAIGVPTLAVLVYLAMTSLFLP